VSDDWERVLQALESWTDEVLGRLAAGRLATLGDVEGPALADLGRPPVEHLERALRVQALLARLEEVLTGHRDATSQELGAHRRLPVEPGLLPPVFIDSYS
jgi:hypothetical protein